MDLLKLVLTLIILFSFVNLASAVPVIELNVNSTFNEGDTLRFTYTILSQQNEQIKYFESISCPGSPEAMLNLKELTLVKNKLFSAEYTYGLVDENIKSGNCVASISILEPYNLEVKKTFEVINLPELSIVAFACNASDCTEKTKIFKQGEQIYFKYISTPGDVIVKGILTLPDSTTRQITFPTSMDADKIGTYNLDIVVKKEGYREAHIQDQFAVIEKDIKIDYTNFENKSNDKNHAIKYTVYLLIAALIIVIILAAITRYRKSKLKPMQPLQPQT